MGEPLTGRWLQIFLVSVVVIICVGVAVGLAVWQALPDQDDTYPRLVIEPGGEGEDHLIWFRRGPDNGNWHRIVDELDSSLAKYEPGHFANTGASQVKCDRDQVRLSNDLSCEFNLEWLSDPNSDIKCIGAEDYGYQLGRPCIMVRMNQVYDWVPMPYFDVYEVEAEVEDMPDSLKRHIRQTWEDNCQGRGEQVEQKCPELNMVWLTCDGDTPADKENLGPVSYTPWQGFPAYYFPYLSQPAYLPPVVMMQLKDPARGVLILVECKAWAKNIQHDRETGEGMVNFAFMMD